MCLGCVLRVVPGSTCTLMYNIKRQIICRVSIYPMSDSNLSMLRDLSINVTCIFLVIIFFFLNEEQGNVSSSVMCVDRRFVRIWLVGNGAINHCRSDVVLCNRHNNSNHSILLDITQSGLKNETPK